MKTEFQRSCLVFFFATLWVVSIALNINGRLLSLTTVTYYVVPFLYIVTIIPDVKYLIKKKKKGLDYAEQFLEFVKNGYRYLFFFLAIPMMFAIGSSIFFRTSSVNEDILQCLEGNGFIKDCQNCRGIVFANSLNIKNGELTEFNIVTSARMGLSNNTFRIVKTDGEIHCELLP